MVVVYRGDLDPSLQIGFDSPLSRIKLICNVRMFWVFDRIHNHRGLLHIRQVLLRVEYRSTRKFIWIVTVYLFVQTKHIQLLGLRLGVIKILSEILLEVPYVLLTLSSRCLGLLLDLLFSVNLFLQERVNFVTVLSLGVRVVYNQIWEIVCNIWAKFLGRVFNSENQSLWGVDFLDMSLSVIVYDIWRI